MDADPSFWPKIGSFCNLSGRKETEKFLIADIIYGWPCQQYVIRSRTSGETVKAFRHELFRLESLEPSLPSVGRYVPSVTVPTPDQQVLNIQDLLENYDFDADEFGDLVDDDVREEVDREDDGNIDDNISDLDDEQLDALDKESKSNGSENSEKWALKKFSDFLQKRNLTIDFASVEAEDLAKTLRKFYAEIRTKDGKYFAAGSLRGLRAGLHRIITAPPYNRTLNILIDKEFNLANKMLENMTKKYVSEKSEKPSHYPAIDEGDLLKLAKYLSKYEDSPEILLHCFWFLLCYLFARRGREGFREMSKSTFQIKIDDRGFDYLVMATTEKTKNWQGGSSSKAWDYSDIRAYGLEFQNFPLSIVEVYKFYLSKLNPKNDALFQKPMIAAKSKSSPFWFTECVIGKNKLAEIMKVISKNAGLSKVYTNHSVRATSISVMYQAGVDTKQICKITKHKNEESLKHYIEGQTSEQKRRCCSVLSAALSKTDLVQNNQGQSTSRPYKPNEVGSTKLSEETVRSNSSVTDPVNLSHVSGQQQCTAPVLPSRNSNTSVKAQSDISPVSEFEPNNNGSPSGNCIPTYSQNATANMQNITMPFVGPQQFSFNVSGGNCHFHFHYDSKKQQDN